MMADLREHNPGLKIQILGMNPIGHELSNPDISAGRTIPWLQDVDADANGETDNWLTSWPYEYRDAVIVDGQNRFVSQYNLTTHNLANATNYDTLRQMIVNAARAEISSPWTNVNEPYDVSNDTLITAIDALFVLNEINSSKGARQLESGTDDPTSMRPVDVNHDGFVTAIDALLIINHINAYPGTTGAVAAVAADSAEGESASGDQDVLSLVAAATADRTRRHLS